MKLNCIVLDNNSMQRMMIAKLLESFDNIDLLGDFSNAIEAQSFLTQQQVDLVILEANLPIISGFDFLDNLYHVPQVIIISETKDEAFRAFEYQVTDYLLKPIEEQRFFEALKKVMFNLQLKTSQFNTETFIFVKSQQKSIKIFTDDIKFIEADKDYIFINTDNEVLKVLQTMKSMMMQLPHNHFLRVHKSFIVNLKKIKKFNHKALEIDDITIPISRKSYDLIKRQLSHI